MHLFFHRTGQPVHDLRMTIHQFRVTGNQVILDLHNQASAPGVHRPGMGEIVRLALPVIFLMQIPGRNSDIGRVPNCGADIQSRRIYPQGPIPILVQFFLFASHVHGLQLLKFPDILQALQQILARNLPIRVRNIPVKLNILVPEIPFFLGDVLHLKQATQSRNLNPILIRKTLHQFTRILPVKVQIRPQGIFDLRLGLGELPAL